MKYVDPYAAAIAEDDIYRKDNGCRHFREPESVVERGRNYEPSIGIPEGFVPGTIFRLVEKDRFIGKIDIRHELTPALLDFGGHIGYEIRRCETQKGYGTRMPVMALPYCKTLLHPDKVMLTCDDDNIGSQKVIEINGGILQEKIISHPDRGTVLTRRYRIGL